MSAVAWCIPPSVLRWLADLPNDAPVALLLRHSVRGHLPHGAAGYPIPITEDGVRIARGLGQVLGARLRTLHTSPLPRCVQTAEALRTGAGVHIEVVADVLLGDPGVFVIDGKRAWPNWQQLGHEGVMEHLVSRSDALPGMAAPDPAARFLVRHMLAVAAGRPGVHVFVTHDLLVTATAARLLDEPLGTDTWPWFLEGAFFWPTQGGVAAAYRDTQRELAARPSRSLSEPDLIDFARREITRIVGPECDARFFLAGGAFKTLLTGRPPRDLDLWAPSDDDRARLLGALASRGARPLDPRPFTDAFEVDGRVVEVPHRTEPPTLEARLGRFDIALSAVGVEHSPGDIWRAVVHPLAQESVERQEVLLLEPLVNWKYALATLERARRYGAELGFAVPQAVDDAIWAVFEAQPREIRQAMLERYDMTGRGGYHVREEALCRLP